MKTRIQKLPVGAALVGAATLVQAQFAYTDNGDGTCTITAGPEGAVTIPNSINALSAVSIGYEAFFLNSSLTSVSIPDSVTTPSWWKLARTWPMPPGFRCKASTSPTACSTSTIPTGGIILPATTASARRKTLNRS